MIHRHYFWEEPDILIMYREGGGSEFLRNVSNHLLRQVGRLPKGIPLGRTDLAGSTIALKPQSRQSNACWT